MIKYVKKPEIGFAEDLGDTIITERVSGILSEVRQDGDKALICFNKEFDNFEDESVLVSDRQIKAAYDIVGETVTDSLREAAANIRKFAAEQKRMLKDIEVEITKGVKLGHNVIAVDSCGCYVPGGRYPLPSSALMSIIPAKTAGVKRVAACSPKSKDYESVHPAVLVAMDIAGADEIYCMGGAHAIGAFAYGTESIKSVNIITGPGNQYVTEAKRQVYGTVNIDSLAGPSEVLIIADDSANADFIAADILAQSEHDPQATGILVTTSKHMAKQVIQRIEFFLESLETKDIAESAWKNNGYVILCDNMEEAAACANNIAPEHLEIQVKEPENLKKLLHNYGSLFIGEYSAEVFGDYSSGTNHILPTVGAARYTGGVWAGTFLKVVTYQKLTKCGAKQIGTTASRLAELEGLMGHKLAADLRLRT